RKELAIGFLNGVVLGLVMAVATLLLYGSWQLAGVMAAAMLLNMLVASAVGVLCPLVLDLLGRDPVMGTSILLTATTDSMGFLIVLGLATLLLLCPDRAAFARPRGSGRRGARTALGRERAGALGKLRCLEARGEPDERGRRAAPAQVLEL